VSVITACLGKLNCRHTMLLLSDGQENMLEASVRIKIVSVKTVSNIHSSMRTVGNVCEKCFIEAKKAWHIYQNAADSVRILSHLLFLSYILLFCRHKFENKFLE
jgi:hypothetical protein